MKTIIRVIILLLLSAQLHAQFIQVTHLVGTASYGGVPITIGTAGNTGSGGGDCLIVPTPYRVGGAPGNLPGTYTFTCGTPVYAIKLYSERIHNTEYVQIGINGSTYTLTPANMVSYTDCHGLFICLLTAGNLAGPVTDDHSGGTYIIKTCGGINSFTVYCNGLVGGSTFHVWVDPTQCVAASNNGPICAGDTLKLFSTHGDTTGSYSWTGPGGFTSTARNPVIPNATTAATGTYTLLLTSAERTDTATTAAVVNDYPVITAGSNSPVCYGATISLTSGPNAPGQTYSWSGPGGYISAVENPVRAPAVYSDTGFYSVIATLNGCSDTATVHVDVIRVPRPSDSSNSSICAGTDLQLYANDTSGIATFTWAGPGGYSSTLQNPVIFGAGVVNSGIYTVTAHIAGCAASDTILANIYNQPPIPTIAVTPPICSGNTLTLSLTSYPGVGVIVYHWSGPNGFSSTLDAPVIPAITMAATGIYSVFAAIGNCTSPSHYVYVQVDSTPETPVASSNSPICSGTTLNLSGYSNTSGVHYSWSGPASFTSTMQNPSIPNAPSTVSGNYSVTAILGPCPSAPGVTVVVVNQTPAAPTMSSNAPVCSGQLLILSAFTAPTGGTYYWTGPNGFSTTVQNPQINNVPVIDSGLYSVYETVNGCTSPVSSMNVTINLTPAVPSATSNSPICQGDTLLLFATDATTGVSYSWSGPNAFASTDQNPILGNISPAGQGLYTVTVTLGLCNSLGITNVTITNTPTITATNNGPICEGDTLKLFAVTAITNTISWVGPYVFTSAGPSPTRYPAISEYSGVYQVTATEPGGCRSTAYDTVIVKPTPAPPWIPWRTYCQFAYSPPLMAVDATNVLWFPTSAGGVGTATPPVPATDVPGIYFFFLNQTVNGCTSGIDSVQVLVNPKPSITVTPANPIVCPHDSVLLTAVCSDPAAAIHWHPTIYLKDSTSLINVARPIADQAYYVTASNGFGCDDTAYTTLSVFAAGIIHMGIEDSVTLYEGESYHISPFTNCTYMHWFPPEGLSNPAISDPVATPTGNTIYIATGITDAGCIVQDSIYFHVNGETLYGIPNAFTPGNGNNTRFSLLKLGLASLNHFRIFDRWGVLVFETKNAEEGWDGNYKAVPQPVGVYVYDVQAVSLITGKVVNMHGNLTLIR